MKKQNIINLPINLKLLKKQKLYLIKLSFQHNLPSKEAALLEGIINMLDSIQDQTESNRKKPC